MSRLGVASPTFSRPRAIEALAVAPGDHAARLLGLLCLAMGALILSTMWLLTAAEARHPELALAGAAVISLGLPLVFLPLETVRRWNLRWAVAATLVIMGFVNHAVTGALGPYRHIYVLIFAFVGLAQPRKTSLVLLPLAVATYLLPELASEDRSLAVVGVVVAAPVWLLTAEALAAGTERLRQTNLVLESRNVEVERYADFQRDFVATASHELRTPITSISGYVELLLEDEALPDEQRAHLRVIARNADRLEVLVQDLLTINKGEAGALEPAITSVSVAEVLSSALDSYSPLCRRKGLELRAHGFEGLPDVYVDAGQIEQALGNLLSNAVKFTPAGGTIEVSCSARPRFVDVAITDTGAGISADEIPRVFDRFFRSADTIKMAVPGTGLGLAIVKSMVESQGGQITVTSSPGNGTTFTISLPTERT
jgi:signal transduction histidine kinase